MIAGCKSSGSAGNGNSANQNAAASFGKTGDPKTDLLLGKWSRVDSEGGHYYLFAGDGFTATFDDPRKADRFEFPLPMRGGADRFSGKWAATETELVFTQISHPDSTQPIEEVRVSLKVLDGDQGIEIDGKRYERGSFDDVRQSKGDEDEDEDADADEDSSNSES